MELYPDISVVPLPTCVVASKGRKNIFLHFLCKKWYFFWLKGAHQLFTPAYASADHEEKKS